MLSVILPVHNGGAYLRRCIESLASQDCAPGTFELIVLENASTDGSLDALRLLPASIPRRILASERLLSIEENWGRIAALEGTREFITTTGHDDAYDPTFVSTVTGALRADANVGFVLTHFRLIDQDDRLIRPCRPMAAWETAGQFLAGRLSGVRDSFGTGYVMRLRDYKAAGGIPPYPKLIYADDTLWLKLAQRHRLRVLEDECFSYRLHASSTSGVTDPFVFLGAFSAHLDFLESQLAIDAGIKRSLETYGPVFMRDFSRTWEFAEVDSANHGNRPFRRDVVAGWDELRKRMTRLTGREAPSSAASLEDLAFALWVNEQPYRRRLWVRQRTRALMRKVASHLEPGMFAPRH